MINQAASDLTAKLAACALDLAAVKPWQDITLSDLCAGGDVALVECAKASINKAHVTAHLDAHTDQSMLSNASKLDRSQSVRDRLFEVLMGRFDVLEDHRAAWVSILKADSNDLVAGLARRARRARTGAWALEASGGSTSELGSASRAIGLAKVMRVTEAVWCEDGPDLAKTMAKLDQELRTGEEWIGRVQAVGAFFQPKARASEL